MEDPECHKLVFLVALEKPDESILLFKKKNGERRNFN